ncbi:hypothetical protein V6N13_042468 [Hibiscus sabdariffa]
MSSSSSRERSGSPIAGVEQSLVKKGRVGERLICLWKMCNLLVREGGCRLMRFRVRKRLQVLRQRPRTNSEACDNVESIYGPYMVVDNSRHRQDLVAHNSSNGFTRGKAISGSRFASLVVDGTDAELPSATSKNGDIKMLQ